MCFVECVDVHRDSIRPTWTVQEATAQERQGTTAGGGCPERPPFSADQNGWQVVSTQRYLLSQARNTCPVMIVVFAGRQVVATYTMASHCAVCLIGRTSVLRYEYASVMVPPCHTWTDLIGALSGMPVYAHCQSRIVYVR